MLLNYTEQKKHSIGKIADKWRKCGLSAMANRRRPQAPQSDFERMEDYQPIPSFKIRLRIEVLQPTDYQRKTSGHPIFRRFSYDALKYFAMAWERDLTCNLS